MNRFLHSKYLILTIAALALALRLIVINQSLWLDEAIGALVVREQTFFQIVTQFPKSDNHPPLYYLTLKAWTNLFGYSELSLRIPSVIFGVLTIYFIYLIGKNLTGYALRVRSKKSLAVISALLLATSPFHIYYSQEARMYMMAGFLASASIYFYLKTFDNESKFWVWVLYSLSTTALIFTDYVPVFLMPVFWIYGAGKKAGRKWWEKFLASHLPMFVLGIIWLPMFIYQIGRGRWILTTLPGWRSLAGGATFKQAALVWIKFVLGRISFRDKLFYYSLVIFSSIPFALTIMRAWLARERVKIAWMWFLIPLALGFLISFLFPAFIYFRFTYLLPAFYLIVAWGVNQYKGLSKNILVILILSINILGWLFYAGEPYQQREQWRQAVRFIESRATDNDIVVFENTEPFAPYRWYMGGRVNSIGVTDSVSANESKTYEKTKNAIFNKNGIYYFEYLRDLSDPARFVEKAIADSGFVVDRIYDFFPGVGQVTYFVKN